MVHRLVVLAGCLVLAATASASAGSIYRQPFGAPATPGAKAASGIRAGIVAGNGSVVYGSGFQVSHPQTGEYDISFDASDFKKCPVISITPAGSGSAPPVANLFGYACNASGVQITVLMIGSTNGSAEDNAFHFIAIEP